MTDSPEPRGSRYQELQAWLGWNQDAARRIGAVADLLDPYLPALMDDFYE